MKASVSAAASRTSAWATCAPRSVGAPDGRRAPDGPLVETVEDKLELVAASDAITPAEAMATYNRPDVTTIPLEGVEPAHAVLATRAGDRSRLVTALRSVVHRCGPGD
ncbi:hypothetical protein [Streptomyces sp. HC307]|uniref:hypothetical protein n=1 Tax=Streptomyces flavusporus TaxID=3385496 RepID=UPI003916EF4F